MYRLICRALGILILLSASLTAFAQTAQLSGRVTDPSQAFVRGADIRVVNEATGVERRVKTNADGAYTVPFVSPGAYQIFVQANGFSTAVSQPLTLTVGQALVFDVQLKVGASTQEVTVDSGSQILNTTNASVSTVIDRKFIENIPLNGRSFQSLLLLTPGVITNNPQTGAVAGGSGELSVNGQRTESNVFTVDGVSANTAGYVYGYGTPGTSGSLPAATALGTTQSLISVDALQELRVSSSSYSAEYGLSPGGQFSFATRSGTNQVHGVAFDYLRNNFFDSNNWFNDQLKTPNPPLRQNDFGGTFGGPVWIPKLYDGRSRSFFFASYEGLRLTQPQAAIIQYTPDTALRQQTTGALQEALNAFPMQNGPEIQVPCTQPVTNGYPCPTGSPAGTMVASGLAQFISSVSFPNKIDSTSIRFDQQITPKVKLFFRFGDTQSATENLSLSQVSSITQSSYVNTFGATTVISSSIVNDFRINYTSNIGGDSTALSNVGGAQATSLLELQGIDNATNPTASAQIRLAFPGYTSSIAQLTIVQPQHAWNLVDSTTIAYWRQVIKFGIDWRQTASRLQRSNPNVYSYFNSSAAVLANNAYSSAVNVYAASYPAYTNLGIYLQDDIRYTQRLGLSLGLRWDVDPPPTQTSGTLPYIVEGDINVPSTLTLAPIGTRFWRTSHYNFAPRAGVTYQAHMVPGWETVARAGGGVFFDSGQQSSTKAFGASPGQSATKTYSNVSYPLTPAQISVTLVNPPVAPYYTTYYFPNRLQLPYTLQWNLSVEQALGKMQTITLSYVGSNGRRLLSQELVVPGAANPSFTYIADEASGTTSNYNALQLQFKRTLSRGLQVLASYNWAHAIDYGSQNLDYTQVRGNSDFDLRHNFNIATAYDIHSHSDHVFWREMADQWGVDTRFAMRTGFPIILNGNQIVEPGGAYAYSGLNLIQNVPVYLHVPCAAGVTCVAGNRRINPAAFALPASGKNGDAPRNFVRGFGMNQIDIAVRRSFPIVDRLNLQFRAEAFNVLNHPNFGYILPTYGNIQFGEATETLNNTSGGGSALYQQGGPRSMQFALKLIF